MVFFIGAGSVERFARVVLEGVDSPYAGELLEGAINGGQSYFLSVVDEALVYVLGGTERVESLEDLAHRAALACVSLPDFRVGVHDSVHG